MTDACESIHYLGFITVIELSLPCVRAKLLGLKSCEVLNQKQPKTSSLPVLQQKCLLLSKLAPFISVSLSSVLLLSLSFSLGLLTSGKMHPPEAALSNLSPKEVIKNPVVDSFPSLSSNSPVPRRAQSPGMKRIDTVCAQYRAELDLYSVTGRLNKTCSTPFINIY